MRWILRVAVFLTGDATPYTLDEYGTYAYLFQLLLREDGDVWRVFDARLAEYPEDIAEFDAVVVTGSASDAHGQEPWISRLNQAIRSAYSEQKKILGVCFGHQAVANALGGRSGRNDSGWELGCRALSLLPAFHRRSYTSGIESLRILEIHQDHVTHLPPGAEVLASTPTVPVQVYALGDLVLGIQGHPEFKNDIVEDLIERRVRDGVIDTDTANEALATLVHDHDVDVLRQMIQKFLRTV